MLRNEIAGLPKVLLGSSARDPIISNNMSGMRTLKPRRYCAA